MSRTITWFEIPATDLKRAQKFYETILDAKLQEHHMGPETMALFPYDQTNKAITGGAVVTAKEGETPSTGTIVYLNAPKFDEVLARVKPAGGKILQPKTDLPDIGFVAQILDTEGNRVGLHGEKPK